MVDNRQLSLSGYPVIEVPPFLCLDCLQFYGMSILLMKSSKSSQKENRLSMPLVYRTLLEIFQLTNK